MSTPSAEGLPELPERFAMLLGYRLDQSGKIAVEAFAEPTDCYAWKDNELKQSLYTADQLRAYGELCRRTASRAEGRMGWDGYDAFEQFLAAEIDAAPEALRRLGEWLCDVLDEDRFATANRMVIGAMLETSAAIRAVASNASPADSPATLGEYDWGAAHEALESMDDYARMDKGVNPYGPYAVLRDLLTKAKGWQEQAVAKKPEGRAVAWRVEWATDGSGQPGHVTLDTERGAMLRANEAMAAGCTGVNVIALHRTITPAAEQGEGVGRG